MSGEFHITMASLDEIDNDNLIYIDVRNYDDDAYMAEQERCNEVIEMNATTGVDISYWIDRATIIEDMRRQRRIGG